MPFGLVQHLDRGHHIPHREALQSGTSSVSLTRSAPPPFLRRSALGYLLFQMLGVSSMLIAAGTCLSRSRIILRPSAIGGNEHFLFSYFKHFPFGRRLIARIIPDWRLIWSIKQGRIIGFTLQKGHYICKRAILCKQ